MKQYQIRLTNNTKKIKKFQNSVDKQSQTCYSIITETQNM